MSARSVIRIVAATLTIMYPVIVYAGLTQFGPRTMALLLLGVLAPVAIFRITQAKTKTLRGLALVPFAAVILLMIEAVRNQAALVFLLPVIINLSLLIAFLATFLTERPMIERFARLQDPDLTDAEVAWCRLWTGLWCGYFAVNATIVTSLGLWGPVEWWTVYTGLIAYILMGLMFATEYVIRKLRFGRLRQGPMDRLLKRFVRAKES